MKNIWIWIVGVFNYIFTGEPKDGGETKAKGERIFRTHNDGVEFESGSLRGYVDVSYKKLVEKFGQPMEGDAYKVDAEWMIKFKDGLYCTIYNYKDGKNYNGKSGLPVSKITNWHIGGNEDSGFCIARIKEVLFN